jgi:hypothetical protein
MAEGRMLLKKTSLSEDVADLKNDTHRMLFFMSIPHLDIKGRMDGSVRKFKAIVCPLLDNIHEKHIQSFFGDAQSLGMIEIYSIDGKTILSFPHFLENQPKLNPEKEAKSKFPDPPEIETIPNNCDDSGVTPEDSGVTATNSPLSLSLPLSLKEEATSVAFAPSTRPEPSEVPVLSIPLCGKHGEHPVMQSDIDRWQGLFPAVDVAACVKRIENYFRNEKPQKQKTKKGIERCITGWLSREQDRGGGTFKVNQPQKSRYFA